MKNEKNFYSHMIARIGGIVCLGILIIDSSDKIGITICGIAIGMSSMLIVESIIERKKSNGKIHQDMNMED